MNKINNLIFSFSLITMLSGCASEPPQKMKRQVVSNPQLDSLKSVDVGSVIYEEFDDKAIVSARIEAPFSFSSYKYEKGELLTGYLIRGDRYFCTNHISQPRKTPCFVDTDLDGRFDRLLAYNYTTYENAALKNNPPKYTVEVDHSEEVEGYKMQLFYQGVVKNNIYISYKEFSDDFSKPAFTQKVKYPLNDTGISIIGYKGSRIEILKGSGTELQYKVIKGFDS